MLVHARLPFFVLADLAENACRNKPAAISPLAMDTARRIDALIDSERGINGETPKRRRAVRRS